MTLRPKLPILALAAAETIVWAGFFYTFQPLLLRWEADFGWSRDLIALALTLSLCASAIAAPLAGRVIDAGRGALMLPLAAIAGGGALVLLSFAENQAMFFAAWALIGAASGFALYEPCFAFLMRVQGAGARGAITIVTLVAGFASTLAFPLAGLIADAEGWRMALRVFAAAAVFIAAPLFWWSARALSSGEPARPAKELSAADRAAARSKRRTPQFWLLAGAVTMQSLTHGMVISHLFPILASRGAGEGAVILAASLLGPAQVAARLAIMAFARGASGLSLVMMSYSLSAAAALLLLTLHQADWRIWLAIFLAGGGSGVNSIAKPSAIAETLGQRGYGAIAGALAAPALASLAAAPFIAALLWRAGGYELVLGLGSLMCLTGVIFLRFAGRAARRPD